jgi:hypothetical protein
VPLSLEAMRNASKPTRAPCTVWKIRRALDPADLEVLDAALADRDTYSNAAISRSLAALDLPHAVSDETISRHRRGRCSCESREA